MPRPSTALPWMSRNQWGVVVVGRTPFLPRVFPMAPSAAAPIIDSPVSFDLTALGGDMLEALQKRVLPGYLMRHRWYGAKDAGMPAVTLLDASALDTAEGQVLLTTLRVHPPGGAEQRYFLPLATVWGNEA